MVFLLLAALRLPGQNNRVVTLPQGDTLNLSVEARGDIQWQQSADSLAWWDVAGQNTAKLSLIAEKSAWYRARIQEGTCDPIHSDPSYLRVIPSKGKMNIVFVLVDDLGWRDLGCYGSDFYETPHIDRLAREGVLFTDAYSAHPVCSPTRASIATGKYPARLHITAYIPGKEKPYAPLSHPADWTKYLPMAELTYAEVLGGHGYISPWIVAWSIPCVLIVVAGAVLTLIPSPLSSHTNSTGSGSP